MEASLYINSIAILGEGAIWNHKSQEFYWIDIENGEVHLFDPVKNQKRSIPVGQRIGTIVPTSKKDIVVTALQDGIYSLDIKSEALNLITKSPFNPSVVRFNDGKCDPAGRFWVGSMALDSTPLAAALYCLEKSGKINKMLDNISISNGLCWSADYKIMYYIDTPTKVVQAFDYDLHSGELDSSRVVIDLKDELGSPDGMTIDAEGKLWIALWGGSSVVRYDPDSGSEIERIEVPAKNVTSCTFGGADLNTLFITTASIGMDKKERQNYPHAGAVFSAIPEVKGVESGFFEW